MNRNKIISTMFLCVLGGVCCTNLFMGNIDWNAYRHGLLNARNIENVVDTTKKHLYSSNFDTFSTKAYGFVQCILNKKEVNFFEIVQDKKGSLYKSSFYNDVNVDGKAIAVDLRKLQDIASKEGANFLFSVTPMKLPDLEDRYYGMPYLDSTRLVEDLLLHLRYYGVPYVDLRQALSFMEPQDVFYKGDSHWKGDAIFHAYKALYLALEPEIQNPHLNMDMYEKKVYKNLFVGSYAKRSGVLWDSYYEDLTVYFPKESNHYLVKREEDTHVIEELGAFEDVLLDKEIETRESNQESLYNQMYLHGWSDFISIENSSLKSGKKLLILHDSFASPIGAYMAQDYKQVDLVSILGQDSNKIVELIKKNAYDDVLYCVHPVNISYENMHILEDEEK